MRRGVSVERRLSVLRAALAPARAAASMAEPEVLTERRGAVGVATLHRPKALNALSAGMVGTLSEQYATWDADPTVRAVLLKGAGGRALCAGGDVRALAGPTSRGDPAPGLAFFRSEYTLNAQLGRLQTPHVALLDGVVMGGGAGVSVHGALRVATERTLFAMPEAVIGFFPDIGASHFLSRLPGRLGLCLALTGARLKGRDVKDVGLATHYVPSERIPDVEAAVAAAADAGTSVSDALDALEDPTGPPPAESVLHRLPLVDRCFGESTVEAIDAALEAEAARGSGPDAEYAAHLIKEMRRGSPTSLKVTLRLMEEARGASLEKCLETDFRVATRFITNASEFSEGVRAQLVDKDGAPKWDPPTLAGVTDDSVASYFEPLEDELVLPRA